MNLEEIRLKIYQKNGLVLADKNEDGEQEFIGTTEKWACAEKEWQDFEDHDCHSSSEDGCEVCQKYAND